MYIISMYIKYNQCCFSVYLLFLPIFMLICFMWKLCTQLNQEGTFEMMFGYFECISM